LLNALVAIYIYGLVPEFLLRFIAWLLVKAVYRLRTEGIEHIPHRRRRRCWSPTMSALPMRWSSWAPRRGRSAS
jgi:1-acyl-sn-glycerol-3-phosphate acyltransferase